MYRVPAATRTDIRKFARDARESFRDLERALNEGRFDDARDFATQAAGCAGEVENLVVEVFAAAAAAAAARSGGRSNTTRSWR